MHRTEAGRRVHHNSQRDLATLQDYRASAMSRKLDIWRSLNERQVSGAAKVGRNDLDWRETDNPLPYFGLGPEAASPLLANGRE